MTEGTRERNLKLHNTQAESVVLLLKSIYELKLPQTGEHNGKIVCVTH